MTQREHQQGVKKRPPIRRRAVRVSSETLVRTGPLGDGPLPLLVQPAIEGVHLTDWAAANREQLSRQLLEHGGILFRGFGIDSPVRFEELVRGVSGDLLEYRERSSPRSQVEGNIYTSTDYPADQAIFLHNENSYQQAFPVKILFCCLQPAEQGGETPIADCRRILQQIDPRIVERFAAKQVMYVRNFTPGFGVPWQTVFQTEDRATVEEYCRRTGLVAEWKSADHLRTKAVRPALLRHPATGETSWFNHATFFHVTTLEPSVREFLLAEFEEEDLPSNSYYGDGSPIEPEVLDDLRALYRRETVAFPWQKGDVLLLDNIFTAHGRRPYSAARQVVVGMAESTSHDRVEIEAAVENAE